MSNDLILESLEQVSESVGDITPLCYEKFFARSPDSEDLMLHMDEGVRGKMMDELYRLIMVEDLASEEEYLNWEVNNHEIAYSVRPETYDHLLSALQDVIRESMGSDWNDAFEQAWKSRIEVLLGEIKPRFSSA